MPSHHSNMESPEPSGFEAELQDRRTLTEEYNVSSGSLTIAPSCITTESDESAVNIAPDESTGFVGSIRRHFRLRHHNNHEFASRHGGLDLVRQNVGFTGRHGRLGLRQRLREFTSRQIGRYRHRRMFRRQDNALPSHQTRNIQPSFEDHDSILRGFDNLLTARQARNNQQDVEDRYSMLRRLDDLLAARQASNSQQNVEDFNSQHAYGLLTFDLLQLPSVPQLAHGSVMPEASLLQNDNIEGHSLSSPSLHMQNRAASSVNSHQSNIPYYTARHDNNDELRGTENSDNDPPSDQSSQVRRGRSLQLAGSNFSDALSEVWAAQPSRDHPEEPRGRRLLRTSSVVSDPWAELWVPSAHE
ncbi:hypothetical protein PDIDSM_2257 [Penicillium digitatum]|nr:hypothetical protein PDIDSM_2257 [Penicillium digitatum]